MHRCFRSPKQSLIDRLVASPQGSSVCVGGGNVMQVLLVEFSKSFCCFEPYFVFLDFN